MLDGRHHTFILNLRMKTKLRVGAIVAALAAITALCVVITGSKKHTDQVSLIFQGYSDLEPYTIGDVAFLLLTIPSAIVAWEISCF